MAGSPWIVVTGGGTGIGRAIVKHFSESHKILACGRRLGPLEEKTILWKSRQCPDCSGGYCPGVWSSAIHWKPSHRCWGSTSRTECCYWRPRSPAWHWSRPPWACLASQPDRPSGSHTGPPASFSSRPWPDPPSRHFRGTQPSGGLPHLWRYQNGIPSALSADQRGTWPGCSLWVSFAGDGWHRGSGRPCSKSPCCRSAPCQVLWRGIPEGMDDAREQLDVDGGAPDEAEPGRVRI